MMVCGSYRRGKPTCGDVDVLITHPDGHSHELIFKPLLAHLKETGKWLKVVHSVVEYAVKFLHPFKLLVSGFLTDDLVTQEDNGNQKKYLGVCRLPGEGRKVNQCFFEL